MPLTLVRPDHWYCYKVTQENLLKKLLKKLKFDLKQNLFKYFLI